MCWLSNLPFHDHGWTSPTSLVELARLQLYHKLLLAQTQAVKEHDIPESHRETTGLTRLN
jgi:hypothetical protein